ncbi:unnamed protein product [Brachionus calyciflorus]|uniref:Uncharacterized protein n=1 Tax=Brachionus calyciflorus TaxID=104777 RepID=A0A814DQW1_9BILA|nr:unnamed protein product [Brachionus calyciflorus]
MSAKCLIEYYNKIVNKQGLFHFRRFIQDYFTESIVEPIKLKCTSKSDFNFEQAKNCLINNLILNYSFHNEDYYFTDDFVHLIELLNDSNQTENNQALLTFLIYLSKADLDFNFYENTFLIINRFSTNRNEIISSLNERFDQFKKNGLIKERIMTIARLATGLIKADYDFEQIEIKFFEFPDKNLHGFSGVDQIYIGINQICNLNTKLKIKLDSSNAELLINLELMRLFMRLALNSVLMKIKNNINFPHPLNEYEETLSKTDFGNLIEMDFFKAQINWLQTGLNDNFQIDNWNLFYEGITINQSYINFNHGITGIQRKKSLAIFGIDYFEF